MSSLSLSTALEFSSSGKLVCELETFQILYMNEAASKVLQRGNASFEGLNLNKFITPKYWNLFKNVSRQIISINYRISIHIYD